MNIKALLQYAYEQLTKAEITLPRLDAEVMLCHVLNVDKIQLLIHPEQEVLPEVAMAYKELIENRKALVPVQYLVNQQEFMGLDFYVDENVLIPRPDTEILVEEVLELVKKHFAQEHVHILDMGTGSGAIAISLAKLISDSRVTAVDLSEEALLVARKNAQNNQAADQIEFLEGNLFEPLKQAQQLPQYQVIVSNPPYIPQQTIETLSDQVKAYEPRMALDGGPDGLDFYRKIVEEAPLYLKSGGWLAMEIGYDQGALVKELMEQRGFQQVSVVQDLAGLDRVVKGKWLGKTLSVES